MSDQDVGNITAKERYIELECPQCRRPMTGNSHHYTCLNSRCSLFGVIFDAPVVLHKLTPTRLSEITAEQRSGYDAICRDIELCRPK
jgi:hypothetical protein